MVEEGARVNYACWARRLVQDDTGRVTGVIYADIDDNLYKVNASKGVILATGDYGGNQQMIQYYMPRVLEDGEWLGWPDTDAKGDVTNIGEGLQMAHWVGARTDYCHAFPNDHYGGSLGCDPMLFVDGSGERFMNEDVTGEVLGEKVTRVNGRCIWQSSTTTTRIRSRTCPSAIAATGKWWTTSTTFPWACSLIPSA